MAEKEEYKLSHSAEEIDEKLEKIEEGGCGYTKDGKIVPIKPEYLPVDTFDLDENGIGTIILGLISLGGGANSIDSSEDDPFWAKFREINPNCVKVEYSGIPLYCSIATKFLEKGAEYFGFKAFIADGGHEGSTIAEATVGVYFTQYYNVDDGQYVETYHTRIIVQM